MTIEFNKLMEQVAGMGKMIEKLDFDLRDRLALATSIFESCNHLDAVRERIQWVRQPEIRYRGAAPLETNDAEEINRVAPPPPSPSAAVILAVDGSQVYPNERGLLHYYLLNIGMYVYHHGIDQDIRRRQFAGRLPGHADDAGFAGCVAHRRWIADR